MKKVRVFLIALIAIAGFSSAFTKATDGKQTTYRYFHTSATYFRIDGGYNPSTQCSTGGDTFCTYTTNAQATQPPASFADNALPPGLTLTNDGETNKDWVNED